MIAPARQAAYAALVAHEVNGTNLPTAIAAVRPTLSDPRDQALLTEITTGSVRMRKALDYQLALRSARPLESLDRPVLAALRLGAFQLLYLDRLPPSAVVNDAVALIKKAGKSSAGALVNAVLRALARQRRQLTWPDASLTISLATQHSHPEWLVARWLERYGPEPTAAWLMFNNQAPRLCLAVNRTRQVTRESLASRLEAEGVRSEPTLRSPFGLQVVSGSALGTQAFRDGWFVVQDEASQLITEIADVRPGSRVLDLCASPGGKTMALAARAGSQRLVACDVRPRRVRLLRQTLDRVGVAAAVVRVAPGGALPFAPAAFEHILVDAPCSGLGTVRRDPDIRWARSPDDLVRLAAAQRALLERAAPLVAPGGTLVYATCSSEPEENEQVVAAFLAGAAGFGLRFTHRTTPVDDGLEAFYAAVLERHV